ncbi:hypothetical protein LWI29_023411 [Acer saccharum]|uniref:Uncharacterized protein n=1 Tax=Acer saccharum TaxID=4024 RepID=A0AA39RQG4_ACESA|nr:hypothetical protein LWI29_023411 [Acer saccharum]
MVEHSISNLFESPLDFVSGKSCSSVCGSTWDFICYIENFCVANLLKMATVLVLSYIVLLFFYLLYKLGICGCIGHSLCRISWACLVSWSLFGSIVALSSPFSRESGDSTDEVRLETLLQESKDIRYGFPISIS